MTTNPIRLDVFHRNMRRLEERKAAGASERVMRRLRLRVMYAAMKTITPPYRIGLPRAARYLKNGGKASRGEA